MNKLGQFGDQFFAPGAMNATAMPFAGSFGGFFMQQVPMTAGAVAYFPPPPMKRGRGWQRTRYPSWPFMGPAAY